MAKLAIRIEPAEVKSVLTMKTKIETLPNSVKNPGDNHSQSKGFYTVKPFISHTTSFSTSIILLVLHKIAWGSNYAAI